MKKYVKKTIWKPCSIFHESLTRIQVQRLSIAFQALDPDNKSMRFSLMLNQALGNNYGRNPQSMRAF